MADNVAVTAGSGTSVATDQIGSDHYQRIKISDGVADSAVHLTVVAEDAAHASGDTGIVLMAVRQDTAASLAGADGDYIPLIVDSTGRLHISNADLATLAGAVSGTEMQADVKTMPATAAEDAALPAEAVVIAADDGTDTHLIQVDANGYLKAILQTGSDAIGKLAANTGVDIGDVDVTSSSGQAAEGAALPGVFYVVAGDDGTDTHPLQVDANGYLKAVLQTSADVDIGAVDVATLPAANLGQQAMAASMSVVPANNVIDATYIGDIKFGEELPAGEEVIGKVAASDIEIELTPTITTDAHTAGDVLFDAAALANAVRVSSGETILHSVKVIDDDDQGTEIDLFFFDRDVTFGTANSAPSISDADAAYYEGSVTIESGDYEDLGGVQVATAKGIGLGMAANATSMYVAAVTQGTPTHTASGLTLKFYFIRS